MTAGAPPTLLAVSPVAPWPAADGMALRVSRILEELSHRWSIVLLSPAEVVPVKPKEIALRAHIALPQTGKWMYLPSQYDTAPVIAVVRDVINTHRPGAAILWSGMEYLHDEVAAMPAALGDRVDCMTLSAWRMVTHARSASTFRRRLSDLAYAVKYELRVRRACAATVVVGDEDARVLKRIIRVPNVHVVPNGVDVPVLPKVERYARPTVVFTGVLSYQPNIDAVTHFVDDIWPAIRARIPHAVFQIVGRRPGADIVAYGNRPGIEVHADVESVHDFLARAWIAVAPMRTGAGLKNKILESWSVGTPAVMTPIATNGLSAAPRDLMLAAEGDRLGQMVIELLTDNRRRKQLSNLASETAETVFSWHSQAEAIDNLLRSLCT